MHSVRSQRATAGGHRPAAVLFHRAVHSSSRAPPIHAAPMHGWFSAATAPSVCSAVLTARD